MYIPNPPKTKVIKLIENDLFETPHGGKNDDFFVITPGSECSQRRIPIIQLCTLY